MDPENLLSLASLPPPKKRMWNKSSDDFYVIKNYVAYSHLDEKCTVNSAPNNVWGSNFQITYNFFYHEKKNQ